MRVLLFGAYPPRLGGISVHLERFHHYLKARHHEVTIIDYWNSDQTEQIDGVIRLPQNRWQKFRLLLHMARATTRDTIVHFHVAAMGQFKYSALPLLLLFGRQPAIITIHAGKITQEMNSRRGHLLIKNIGRLTSKIICVNQEQAAFFRDLGIPQEKLAIIPAFIPPEADPTLLPDSISAIQGQKTIVLGSGYLVDYYNHDVLIECISELNPIQYQFVFCFYGDIDPPTQARIMQRIEQFNNVLVFYNLAPEVFASIVQSSDIYVRTPLSDGDAITVREALFFGKTVFASDCVNRPEGVMLFSASDALSLLSLFRKHEQKTLPAVTATVTSNVDRVYTIYEEIVQRREK